VTATLESRGRCAQFTDRRARVVQIAAELFCDKGYAAASVQDLADAVGVHKSTIFHYFDCKDDVLFSIVSEVCAAVDGVGRSALALDGPPLERVTDYLRRFIGLGASRPAKFAVYRDDVGRLAPARRAAVERHREAQRRLVASLLSDAQRGRVVSDRVEPDVLAEMLIDGAHGLSAACSRGRRATCPDVMTDFLLRGVTGGGAV
jgi:AcrR family transcriptional regulator